MIGKKIKKNVKTTFLKKIEGKICITFGKFWTN